MLGLSTAIVIAGFIAILIFVIAAASYAQQARSSQKALERVDNRGVNTPASPFNLMPESPLLSSSVGTVIVLMILSALLSNKHPIHFIGGLIITITMVMIVVSGMLAEFYVDHVVDEEREKYRRQTADQ